MSGKRPVIQCLPVAPVPITRVLYSRAPRTRFTALFVSAPRRQPRAHVTAFREAKAGVESVMADAGDKGQQALNYAGKKGQEAMDNVRGVGDTLAVAVEKSVTTRPYTSLALAVAAGFLFGAIWRR